ncbi:hypothetical protein D3OALGA1CA_4579 [Olavius algarvensis associated proteobacterium Delta 3]|nr:hypothetical protein D3OALGA1CA_4579 [Olavius algarvensis associated proteobacterium Delta 3]
MGRHVPKRVDTDSGPDTDSDDSTTFIHGNNPPVGMVI